ncbi:MAG TPA: BON domain-containing protein [Stellaceae bacterium]|jgi:osmotically-inducible protein OsmY
MLRIDRTLPWVIVLAAPLALGGCAGALVVGGLAAAGGAGYEAASERGVDGSYDDYAIKSGIQNAWNNADPGSFANFNVTVYGRDVLLTGDAGDEGAKQRAFQLASQVPGIQHIYNEIEVGNPENGWDTAQDAWMTAQLRKDLVLEQDVRSDNYTIETANGSIYLMGSARSQEELAKATYLARYVPGVRRVVSYVQIRSGVPIAQGQSSPPPLGPSEGYNSGPSSYSGSGPSSYSGGPDGGYTPPSAPAGNSTPIQVQKL